MLVAEAVAVIVADAVHVITPLTAKPVLVGGFTSWVTVVDATLVQPPTPVAVTE